MLSHEIRYSGEGNHEVAYEAAVDDQHCLLRRNRAWFQPLKPDERRQLPHNGSVLQVKTFPPGRRKLLFWHPRNLKQKGIMSFVRDNMSHYKKEPSIAFALLLGLKYIILAPAYRALSFLKSGLQHFRLEPHVA